MAIFDNKSKQKPPLEKSSREIPWVEKYRPRNLDEISAQEHAVAVLTKTLHSSNLSHMLFYGPPGTGKTSTILALCRELFGPELMKSRVLELNASDERGISIVRQKIKSFARATVSAIPLDTTHPAPPYKIIILDEADSMTQDAQSALRRTMETYSRITRFCLICNYVTRIIEPLASRCAKFRFKSLEVGGMGLRLRGIAESEGVVMENGVIDAIIRTSDGDMRKGITYLQTASKLLRPPSTQKRIDEDIVMADASGTQITVREIEEIAGVVPDEVINNLLQACQPSKTGPGLYTRVEKIVSEIVAEGYGASQIMLQFHELIIQTEDLSAGQKNKIMLELGEIDKMLVDGSDEELGILDLGLRVGRVLEA